MNTKRESPNEACRLDVVAAAHAMSHDLSKWAMELFIVPMLADVAACHSPTSPYGALLAEALEAKCGQTFVEVTNRWPNVVDAHADSDTVRRVVEFINARGDDLMAQALGLATELGSSELEVLR